MSDVIDPTKRFNYRHKVDSLYEKGFDYDNPTYANVPDGLKWALPIHEATETPEYKAKEKKSLEESKRRVEREHQLKNISVKKDEPRRTHVLDDY